MKKQNEIREGFTRVTSVLNPFTDFSMIEPAVLANASDRGTRVHNFCELYAKNLLIEPVDEDCKPYVESFIEWFDNFVGEVLHVEERLYCDDLKITGQIDLICKLKGSDRIYIIDLKTPQTSSKSWKLQTAAYQYLSVIGLGYFIQERGCLMLDKNGGQAKFISYTDYEKDSTLYFSALKLYRFFIG